MPSTTLEFKEIKIMGLSIRYREILPKTKTSPDKTLIILHGWNQKGAESWQEIMGQTALQHPNYHIIAPDLPGMGDSPAPDSVWRAEDYATFIEKFIAKLDVKYAVFMGHSFGGAIASIIASRNPKLCTDLILLAPAIVRPPLSAKQKRISSITSFGKNTLTKIGLTSLETRIKKGWYKLINSPDYNKTQGIMKAIMQVVIREDLTHILPNISCHTTLLWGDKDTYTPIWQLDLIRRAIPNNQVYILDDINHGIHLYAKKSIYNVLKKVL
jgi:pimeloyl-ACP methyl ester carboxylesterase